ncbi:MAG: hypothetical protein WBA97_17000 [Actinophytocola sp.]|uniref:hypothetical protein n=1 Tax=Actinophytocola sp. TaxID=1872138 RepID=UPI003C76FDB5
MATKAAKAVPMTATTMIPGQRTETATPDIRPRAGHDLFVRVDMVLALLAEPGETIGTIGLADDLRTALARTAAMGDSCRIRPQCDAVRLAADLLLAGEVLEAHAILASLQIGLGRLPGF